MKIKTLLFTLLLLFCIISCFGAIQGDYKLKLTDIRIRDPFILSVPSEKLYYMYGTGGKKNFNYYSSPDLENWSEAKSACVFPENFWAEKQFWAPEVHKYKGKYYMFATFKSEAIHRGTQIFVSDKPYDFKPLTDFPVTPKDWECLDGTLWIENNIPYMIFCHEWTQIKNGTIEAIQLSNDLKNAIGQSKTLFTGSSAPWVPLNMQTYVTDGPFIVKSSKDKIYMLWSSIGKDLKYKIGIAQAKSILGPWKHIERTLDTDDGGHGMIFKDFNGNLKITYHAPNSGPKPIAVIKDIIVNDKEIKIK